MGTLRPPNVSLKGKKKHKNSDVKPLAKERLDPPAINIVGKGNFNQAGYEVTTCAGKDVCINKQYNNKVKIQLNPEEWVFGEADLLTSWNTEDNGLTITKNSLDYINKKAEGIRSADLLKYYSSFIGAYIFKNHNQDKSKSKGIILDATLRAIEIGDTADDKGVKENVFYTRGLLAVNRKDDPKLSKAFEDGTIKYGSMGNFYYNKQCSVCGKLGLRGKDSDTRCVHLKMALGQWVETPYGQRRVVEYWSDIDSNGTKRFIQFYEYSLLTGDPAFNGSAIWKQHDISILSSDKPIIVEVEESFLKKEAFQKYINNGSITILN